MEAVERDGLGIDYISLYVRQSFVQSNFTPYMFVERTSDVICERARFGRDRPDLIHSLLERPVLVDIRRHRDSMRLLSFASTRI